MSRKGGKPGVRAAIEAAQPAPAIPATAGTAPAFMAARFIMRPDGLFRTTDDPDKSFWICGPLLAPAGVPAARHRYT
jgi:hypothetical protein